MGKNYPDLKLYLKTIRVSVLVATLLINSSANPVKVRQSPEDIPDAPFKDGCRILINEIRLDLHHPFLELARYCKEDYASLPNQIDLSKYAIVVVDQEEFIIGYCRLSGKYITEGRWFYLVGDGNNVNQNIYECQWSKSVLHDQTVNLPWKNTAIAVFLMKNDRSSVLENFSLPKVAQQYVQKKILPSFSRTLMANLQDFYILAHHTMEGNDILKDLNKYWTYYNDVNRHIIYIDYTDNEKISVSRCGSRSNRATYSFPFQSQLLKITQMSPGRINECIQAEPPKKKLRMDLDVNTHQAQADPVNANNENAELDDFVFQVLSEKEFEAKLEKSPDLFWKDCGQFPENKIKDIQQLPFTPINIEDVLKTSVCTWLDFIMPLKKLICKKCNILLKQRIIVDRKQSRLISNIMKTGTIKLAEDEQSSSKARKENARIITDHSTSKIHEISEQYFELFGSGLRGEELNQALMKKGGPYRNYYKATENIVLATVQSVKMNIPFNSFKILAETLDYFGADIGHLYRTPKGARTVSDVVGRKLHKDLIEQLLKLDNELSITLDSTTDIAGYGLLGVIFQTFNETGHVNQYLYRIMPLPDGEKGEDLFKQFMASIEADGLTDYIKRKTVGLTTDGHPAVRSVFRRKLNEKIENELVGVWCAAHMLELIASKAFESFPYLVEVDNFVNRIFRLLTAKSPLRREEFRKQIPLFGFRLFEFKRVRKLRWLAHHVRALSPYIFRYAVLVGTLEVIAAERKFNLHTRQEAQDLLRQLKDGTFVATIAFTADVLEILAELSNEYQRINNTPIGKKFLRDQLYTKLAALENQPGTHIKYLLQNSDLIRGVRYRDPILTFESGHVKFNGVVLNEPDPIYEDYRLSAKMESYVDEILAQVQEYYPGDVLDKFDVLYAKQFPPAISTTIEGTYGRTELLELNNKLKWNYNEQLLIMEWRNLLISLYAHPEFRAAQALDPEAFWTKFLQENYIEWSQITKEIVKKALTIPASSAQPERIFSMYSYVKNYHRYNLLPSTVENIIRIKFNGKKNILDWNMVEFGKELISENHSRADDKSRRRTWKKAMQELEIVDEENFNLMVDEIDLEEQVEDEIFI